MQVHTDNASVDAGFDMLDYAYANESGSGKDKFVQGEKQLWSAVINQAFIDINDKEAAREAIRWLLYDRHDFALVCSLAGISPITVRNSAKRILSCRLQATSCK